MERIFLKVRKEGKGQYHLTRSFSSLPETLDRSFKHAEEADLCLAMGSSLTVTPAADIPEVCVHYMTHLLLNIKNTLLQIVGKKKRLVIVNLQATPLDGLASLRVFAKCDDFTKLVMGKLGMEIPQFRLKR